MELEHITETLTGLPVKNLKFNQVDNIIVGQVWCELTDKFIVCQWRTNGTATNFFKGRLDLRLKM